MVRCSSLPFTFISFVMLLAMNSQAAKTASMDEPTVQRDVEPRKRVPGDSAGDSIMAELACTGAESVCEADCIAMLCHGKPQIMYSISVGGKQS